MKKFLAALGLVLLAAATSAALTLPGPAARKPGNLSVTVAASDSIRYIRESVALAQANPVVIDALHKVRPGDLVYFAFLVSGLTPDKKGEVRFAVGYRLLDPTGKVLFEGPDYAKGRVAAPASEALLLADPAVELVMEHSDPQGKYRLEAKVTDQVTKKTATGVYEISLVKQLPR